MVVGEIIGIGKEVVSQILQLDVMLIFIILFVFIIIAYKVFRYLMKAFITGMLFAFIPILINFFGFPVTINFQVIFQYAIFGIIVFIVYSIIHTGLRAVGFVLSPFKKSYRKKERVVVKEVEKPKKKRK
jgi:hypothetical protein